MEKIESFELVLDYLKERVLLTTNGKNTFVLRKDRVICRQEGSSYKLTLEDFRQIHGKDVFYVMEDRDAFIDESKDEAYYRYYKK